MSQSKMDDDDVYSDEDFQGYTVRDHREFIECAEEIPSFSFLPQHTASRKRLKSFSADEYSDEELSHLESQKPAQNVVSCSASRGREQKEEELTSDQESDFSDFDGEFSNVCFYSESRFGSQADLISDRCDTEASDDSSLNGDFSSVNFVSNGGKEGGKGEEEKGKEDVAVTPNDRTASKTTTYRSTGKKRSSIMSPESVMTRHCCKSACINKLTLNQVQHARQSFIRNYGTNEKQRQFVLDWLDSNRPKEDENQFCYSVCGITVCVTCWLNVLGITRRKFYMLKKEYLSNRRSGTHGNAGMFRMSWCSEIALTYLTNYFEHMCDYMPTRNVMHLPSNIRKHEVYEEMKATLESQGQTCCSRPTFNNLWKEHFPNVKIPKENRFGKCDTCSQIKKQLKEKQEFEEKELIYASRARHHEFVRKERQTYINRSIKGHREPNSYFSVAIDGMDQNKTELPFSPLRFSLLNTAWRLKVHVVGVMVHGRNPILFLDYQQHLHDSNLTINILLQVFWMHRARLADIVYLQMDNTCRENKNQFVFALCSYLIETKVFKEIHISFLPKGHTHIDVDQLFSRLSVAISRNGCLTPTDLHRLIGSCYKQSKGETTQEGATPKVSHLQHLYAIREWLMPYIDEVHNLRPFHQFKFYLNEEGKCLTDFKPWCVDEWDAQKWPPLKILKSVPESEPEIIVPSYEMVDINRLGGMVQKCVSGGVLNKTEEEEWVNFLDEQQKVIQSYEDMEQVHYCTENGNKSKYHNKDLKYIPAMESGWIIDDLLSRRKPSPAETPSLCAVLKESEDLQNGRGIMPAYTGPYRNPRHIQRNIIRDQSIEDVEEGMLVAVNLQKYKERPQIGKVIALNEKTIEVEWYNGSWTTQWKPHKVRQGRHLAVWKEEISKSSVILYDFSLTPGNKLREATKRELKQVYDIQ